MVTSTAKLYASLSFIVLLIMPALLSGQTVKQSSSYHIYAGSTHAHTIYTGSHGEQLEKSDCKGILVFEGNSKIDSPGVWSSGYVKNGACPAILIVNSSQFPGPQTVLKPDWNKYQGQPSDHYSLAKEKGYDFYVTTDHSQEYIFNPPDVSNGAWVASHEQAAAATDTNFIAITGYEHSENNGPKGEGHINVINSAGYLNALVPGIDLPYLYGWLDTVSSAGDGPVVASFNHPGAHQYNDWAYRDPKITDIITMLEVINSNNKIHYEGFVNALDKGWKVSPVCGNDNHGLSGIKNHTSRTFVVATSKTKAAILDAMKNRRTYASLDQNIQCSYTVNGEIMGSTLHKGDVFKFNISINDPDTKDPDNKITRIDIVKDGGEVVQTYNPASGYSVKWNPSIHDRTSKYFFVRVWNAGGGDAPGADPSKPIVWLAPVWTGR